MRIHLTRKPLTIALAGSCALGLATVAGCAEERSTDDATEDLGTPDAADPDPLDPAAR